MSEEFRKEEEQPNIYIKPGKTYSKFLQPEEKKPNNSFGVVIIILLLAVLIAVIFALVSKFSVKDGNQLFDIYKKEDVLKLEKQSFGGNIFNKRQNILVLGVDSNGSNADPFKGTRSDTILIFSIYPKTKSVNILSIPRDSKVYLAHNKGIDKINAAHAIGGINLTKDTIEETFGIKIHNYIVFNTHGVVDFIDAIGGVPVYVEKDMKYHDYTAGLNVNLTKGEHLLTGKQAEGFLRFRKDALGDIGRTSRQQWFLSTLAKRLKDPAVIPKIPEALQVIDKSVKSNLSLYQLSQYAAFAAGMDMSMVETATLPGAPNKRGYISYWILNPDQCREVINRMIYNKNLPPEDNHLPVAGILYTGNNQSDAEALKTKLEEEGFTVHCRQMKHLPHPQIFGHTPVVTSGFVHKLKDEHKEVADLQFVYDPIRFYCANSDFTVILSKQ